MKNEVWIAILIIGLLCSAASITLRVDSKVNDQPTTKGTPTISHPNNQPLLVWDKHGHAFTMYPNARWVERLPDADRSAIDCKPEAR